jgi:hypothetical protein
MQLLSPDLSRIYNSKFLNHGESMIRDKQETREKPSSNRSAKDRRNTLFRVLAGVLSLSHRKIHSEGNSDKAKQGHPQSTSEDENCPSYQQK